MPEAKRQAPLAGCDSRLSAMLEIGLLGELARTAVEVACKPSGPAGAARMIVDVQQGDAREHESAVLHRLFGLALVSRAQLKIADARLVQPIAPVDGPTADVYCSQRRIAPCRVRD